MGVMTDTDLFRDLLEETSDAILIVDPGTGQLLDANRIAYQSLGYTREEFLARKVGDIIPHIIPAALASRMEALRRIPHLSTRSYRRRADGSEFPVESRATLVTRDREYIVLISRDISEARLEDTRAGMQTDVMEALLDLPDAMERLGEREFIQFGEELAERLTGSQIAFTHFVDEDAGTIDLTAWSHNTLAHYCTASFDAHYPVESAGVWADAVRNRCPVTFNDYATCTAKRGLPEGHAPLHRLISVPVISGGKVRMVTGVGNKPTDYSESDIRTVHVIANAIWSTVNRRRSDLALAKSEEELRLAIQTSGVGSWTWDLPTDSVTFSPEWETMLGFEPATTRREAAFWQERVVPEDRERVTRALMQHIRTPDGEFHSEFRMRHADNTPRWFMVKATVSRDADGKAQTVQAAAIDITAIKQAEEDLSQSRRRESVSRLAGGTAHFFNNLLAVISGYTELALQHDSLEPGVRKELKHVYEAAARAASLNKELLAYSQGQIIRPEVVQPGLFLHTLEARLRDLAGPANTVAIEVVPAAWSIVVDRAQLEHVIEHLVANARDAMSQGGAITVRAENAAVGIALGGEHDKIPAGEYLCLSVEDTGAGIAVEHQVHLFEPFFTTKPLGTGTGLGLASVFGIVKQCGGGILYETHPGTGTTFRVYLPRVTGQDK